MSNATESLLSPETEVALSDAALQVAGLQQQSRKLLELLEVERKARAPDPAFQQAASAAALCAQRIDVLNHSLREAMDLAGVPMQSNGKRNESERITWTIFIRDANNQGTTFITTASGTRNEAIEVALEECKDSWGYDSVADLRVLGLARGDVDIVEWDDAE